MKKKEDSNRFGVMDDTEMVEELKEFLERSRILDEQAKKETEMVVNCGGVKQEKLKLNNE